MGERVALTMNVLLRSASALVLFGAALAASAQTTLNFETVSTTNSFAAIPNGYGGLNWNNAFVEYGPAHASNGAANALSAGYETGVRSGSYAAFNGSGTLASLSTPTSTPTIGGFSGYFTAAVVGTGSTSVTVQGLRGGVVVGTLTAPVTSTGPTFLSGTFASPADTLTFVGNLNTFGGQIVLDDLTVNPTPAPEPATFAALGLGALAFVNRRKRA